MLINGYNNDLKGWGHEDEELAARFINNGILKKQLNSNSISFVTRRKPRTNEPVHAQVVQYTLKKIKACDNGIAALTQSNMNEPAFPGISLIVSTYNWTEALNLCLISISKQHILPDEVIADDGSAEETKKLITRHQKTFQFP
ncbi:hypothetical protein CS542_04190 [Pedobacter sp. IW39]|nr:hypothetical protein CS542_04190 [Pedobacter sp. IW39]